jgi:hypothetical protein
MSEFTHYHVKSVSTILGASKTPDFVTDDVHKAIERYNDRVQLAKDRGIKVIDSKDQKVIFQDGFHIRWYQCFLGCTKNVVPVDRSYGANPFLTTEELRDMHYKSSSRTRHQYEREFLNKFESPDIEALILADYEYLRKRQPISVRNADNEDRLEVSYLKALDLVGVLNVTSGLSTDPISMKNAAEQVMKSCKILRLALLNRDGK